jgi:hypothetical protein
MALPISNKTTRTNNWVVLIFAFSMNDCSPLNRVKIVSQAPVL